MKNKRPILLTSLPRSGSTWCLKVLEKARNVKTMHEPDHLDKWLIGHNGMHPYISLGKEDAEYEYMYKRCFMGHQKLKPALSGHYSGHYLKDVVSALFSCIPIHKRIIVKSVFSLANTEWIYKKFNPQVIVLLRNPYSVAHSIHRKWPDARLRELLEQKHLMEDHLNPYKDIIEQTSSPYQILASRIGAYHHIVLKAATLHKEWIVVKHEDLCSDPISRYRSLYKCLDLEWEVQVENYIRTQNQPKCSDNVHHVQRVAVDEIYKWRRLLSNSQICEIRDIYESFNNNVYDGIANDV